MSERESHCPFLNRADSRCANHFSLDRLDRAFDHCFGEYHACANYQELLDERRERQPVGDHAMAGPAVFANISLRARPANVTVSYVQVRTPTAHAAIA